MKIILCPFHYEGKYIIASLTPDNTIDAIIDETMRFKTYREVFRYIKQRWPNAKRIKNQPLMRLVRDE